MSRPGTIPTLLLVAGWTLLMVAAGAVLVVVEHLRRFRAWVGER